MTARDGAVTEPAERVLEITRVFDAPPSLVFKAWTDPAHAARWAGPRGFTATHLKGDVRPGGAWRTCLRRDEDGEELWQGGTYREVVEPERLVFTFAWDGEDGRRGHETLVTVTFAEHQGGKTRMTFRQAVFESVGQRDGHQGGWNSAFDRLAEHVAGL
ncbi:MAG TPA: SRPBCC domain-containing protein [Geminicoccaceae bacterium]|nr:SRPBCC domain-containing protein [Geminicoccaceae bacterium]